MESGGHCSDTRFEYLETEAHRRHSRAAKYRRGLNQLPIKQILHCNLEKNDYMNNREVSSTSPQNDVFMKIRIRISKKDTEE